MSATRVNNMDLLAPAVVETVQRRALAAGLVFAVLAVLGAVLQPEKFFSAYLLGYMAWLGLSLGSMAFLMLGHLTGGDWGQAVRRIFEAATRTVPLMILLFVPVILGMHHLYTWMRPEDIARDKHLQDITRTYLTPGGFILRAAIYFSIWLILATLLSRWSAEQDIPPERDTSSRFRTLSGPGLVLYGFTLAFASIDWIMSLNPHWISTIYGLIFLAGQCLSSICFVVVVSAILHRYKPMSEYLKPNHIHDYGNLMLTLVMLWAYFAFSQWLIIWAGNLPEEISWFTKRLHGGWQYVGLLLGLFHFVVPFLFLLARGFKRRLQDLVWLAVFLMLMRFVDLFWYIEPTFHLQFHVSWQDVVVPAAIGGFWLAWFCRNLRGRPLLPLFDRHTRLLLETAHE
ncbi:MAG TPA: hypothetical protein VJP02_08395 [Candidatus Sulfotelmatobacter sp.]|nr:hypothetical protein [Candidatus Sulfotelmatobacter sp.]